MSFEYKTFAQSLIVPNTEADVVVNSVSAELLYIRTVILTNVHATNVGVVKLFLVPNVAGALGTPDPDDRIFVKSVAVDAMEIIEFPIPGLILEYNDVIRAVCDNADTINLVMTGGREY